MIYASIAQWIERRPPEPSAWVRLPLDADFIREITFIQCNFPYFL